MDGANMLVATGKPRARHAIIGEPTDLRPVRMHKGMMMEAVTVTGQSGHSSNPALGRNALEGMQQVMADLLAFRDELAARHRNPLFEVEVPTLNFGCIHGGDNPNRICGECELHFDLRPLPGMDLEELRAVIRERLDVVAVVRAWKSDALAVSRPASFRRGRGGTDRSRRGGIHRLQRRQRGLRHRESVPAASRHADRGDGAGLDTPGAPAGRIHGAAAGRADGGGAEADDPAVLGGGAVQ